MYHGSHCVFPDVAALLLHRSRQLDGRFWALLGYVIPGRLLPVAGRIAVCGGDAMLLCVVDSNPGATSTLRGRRKEFHLRSIAG